MTVMMMMSENQTSQSQVHVTAIRGTEDLAVKSQFTVNRLPSASTECAGGTWFSLNTSHMMGNWQSMRVS